MKYRKRSIEVEAVQMTEGVFLNGYSSVLLATPSKVGVGDLLITGVKGEKYFCKDDIFKLIYEAVR